MMGQLVVSAVAYVLLLVVGVYLIFMTHKKQS